MSTAFLDGIMNLWMEKMSINAEDDDHSGWMESIAVGVTAGEIGRRRTTRMMQMHRRCSQSPTSLGLPSAPLERVM